MSAESAEAAESHPADFVVVANRLPVDRASDGGGGTAWRTAPGGLVTALEPVMRDRQGAWVGWHGAPDEALDPFDYDGYHLVPVQLSAQEVEEYYEGFSNGTLWPLYHDVVAKPEYHREWWDAYHAVNERFAEATAQVAAQGATVWVQDYQLQLVPQMLRQRRPDLRIGYFLHIPFPPIELFQQLPWRRQIIEGLLGADIIGFQTPGGAQNFTRICRHRLKMETHREVVTLPTGRSTRAKAYPISIDAKGLESLAQSQATLERAAELRRELGDPEVLFLGVDRLDYTKGIYHRLRAYGELVADGIVDPRKVAFLQVATPSRERVEEYKRLRDEVNMLVGRINGDLGDVRRPAITYLHASFPRAELAAMYTAADVCVVTPLRDGMNLVCKEYVACRSNTDGALVLSEFTGAAGELRQAYMINPYDINSMKHGMTLAMNDTVQNKRRRMRALRRQVFTHDIDAWATSFLDDLAALPPAQAPSSGPQA
ncbi:alpha,alpha-trehalose-phosphate synthase (UDP-forming) [Raineyella fluvialis]|uniref:Trehalose-6-phosphate synthase n=1 Tax=Raineyella fluvialis TaxID=2662261 RepID=A0A5Q2FGY1_9ACTN|nr:trehalose-6-phosphate synthase [Raineyella fluvialis]QGF24373.1 trehalose-6-phosphate synthase [Raineyella fluvialis]